MYIKMIRSTPYIIEVLYLIKDKPKIEVGFLKYMIEY